MIPRYAPTYTYSDVLRSLSGCLLGDVVDDLRCRLARLYKVKHVFLFGGARVALYALLRAYDRPGGVLGPAYNCWAVPEAVLHAGYSPVFADIDYNSLNMTASTVEQSISPDTTVVLITHQFGIPCDVDEILRVSRRYGILVVEDAAAAIGAKFRGRLVGSFGDATLISFKITKVISGGVGGALLTDNDELAYKVDRLLQAATAPESYCRSLAKTVAWKIATSSWLYPATLFGYRALRGERMFEVVAPPTEIPASFLTPCSRFLAALVLMQLDRLDWNLSRRRRLAQIYREELSGHSGLTLPAVPEDCSPAWTQFPLLVNDKRAFYKHMQRNRIDLSWTHRYSCADSLGLNGFPNTQRAAQTLLGLPTYPSLPDERARYICAVAKEYPSAMR